MAGVAGEQFIRMAFAPESSFKVAGAYVVPKGAKGWTLNPGREQVAYEGHLNSYGDRESGIPGYQTFEAGGEFYVHGSTYSELAAILDAALGNTEAGGTLTAGGAGTNDTENVAYNVGTPGSIIRVRGNDGLDYLVPVDTTSGGSGVLGHKLPTGVTASSIDNLSEITGAVYSYLLGTSADTLTFEFDWAARSTEISHLAKGCAITELVLNYEEKKPLSFGVKIRGAEWVKTNGSGSNTSNPGRASNYFMSASADFFLAPQASKSKWGDTPTRIRKFTSGNLANPLIDETGSNGLTIADSTLPGSPILGYTREPGLQDLVRVLLTYPSHSYYEAYEDQTAYRLFGVFYTGVPASGIIAGIRFPIYYPELVIDEQPKIVIDGGHRCMELAFRVKRRLANTIAPAVSLGLCTLP
jgi:hypothetical protein